MTPPAEMTAHTAHAPEAEEKKSFVRKYVFSIDHKVIGKQFLFSSLLFFVVGGLLALLMRTQLAWPWEEIPVVGDVGSLPLPRSLHGLPKNLYSRFSVAYGLAFPYSLSAAREEKAVTPLICLLLTHPCYGTF